MKPIRRKNAWAWGKPCSCCAQFDADKKRAKKVPKCCFCSAPITDEESNSPFPLCEVDDKTSLCCDECNETKVLPMRMRVRGTGSPEEARKKALELLSAPPPEPYPNLHSIITRTMDSYYGYGSAYGRGTQN